MSQLTAEAEGLAAPEASPASTDGTSFFRRVLRWCLAHPGWTVFLVAIVIRFAIALIIYVVNGGALFGDETTYTGLAQSMAEGSTEWWDDFITHLYWNTASFTVPLTILFELFGPKIIYGQLLAATYAAAAAGLVAKLAGSVVRPSLAIGAGLVVALLPSQLLFSVLVLKDSTVWLLLAALAYVVVRVNQSQHRPLLGWMVAAALLLYLLGHVRDHTTVAATWALLPAVAIPSAHRLRRLVLGSVVVIVVPIFAGIGPVGLTLALHHGDLAERRADNAEGANTAFVADATGRDLQKATEARVLVEQRAQAAISTASSLKQRANELDTSESTATAAGPDAALQERERARRREELRLQEAAAAAEAARRKQELAEALAAEERARRRAKKSPASNLNDLFGSGGGQTSSNLRQLPLGVRVMLVDPLPWESTTNSRVNLAKTEMVLWYPLLALAAVGAFLGRRRLRVIAFPILVATGIVGLYALSEGNFGTAFRHRGEVVWAIGLLAAVGAEALLRRRADEPAVLPAD